VSRKGSKIRTVILNEFCMLPKEFLSLMLLFAPLFSKRIWQRVLELVMGAILAPGKRTVSAILRVMVCMSSRIPELLPLRVGRFLAAKPVKSCYVI